MEAAETKGYTIEDIYALPEGERAELIDGVWYDMASPGTLHQAIVMAVAAEFRDHIRDKGGKCRVFSSPVAVFLKRDNRNYLEPDVIVVCDESKLDERGCNGAPDIVVEVVSLSSKKLDYGIKLFKYRMAGVREYWIINPETKTINTFRFSDEEESELGDQVTFDEEIPCGLFPDLKLVLSEAL